VIASLPIPALRSITRFSTKAKVSGYWSKTSTESAFAPGSANADGLPIPIYQGQGHLHLLANRARQFRLLADSLPCYCTSRRYTDDDFHAPAPISNYDAAKELGLRGATRRCPQFPISEHHREPRGA